MWESAHYHNIMNNYLGSKNLKAELFSEIYINWAKNPKKIEDLFNRSEREFGGYFNITVRNNVVSSTSPFYKNCIKTQDDVYDAFGYIDIEEEDEIELKIEKEIKLANIKRAILKAKLTWFEHQIFLEYYTNKVSYSQIAKKYDLNKSYLYKLLRDIREKIKKNV